jgi:hypothetical protein
MVSSILMTMTMMLRDNRCSILIHQALAAPLATNMPHIQTVKRLQMSDQAQHTA